MKKAVILFADGFEEVEGITQADFLRRAGIEVTLAGVKSLKVRGSRGIDITCDALLSDLDEAVFDAVVVPGGMPGAANVYESSEAGRLVKAMMKRGALVAGICAAPAVVLEPLGILEGKKATCYPGFEKRFHDASYSPERVVKDGNLITSQGPGSAAEFAFAIIGYLLGEAEAAEVQKATLN